MNGGLQWKARLGGWRNAKRVAGGEVAAAGAAGRPSCCGWRGRSGQRNEKQVAAGEAAAAGAAGRPSCLDGG